MASPAAYSRFVRAAKVILPLLAVGILSVLFFVAEGLDPDAAIPYAEIDVDRALRERGLTNPSFGGLTENGSVVSLRAERMVPQPDGSRFAASVLSGALELAAGGRIEVSAQAGSLDASTRTASLSGPVRISETGGHEIVADRIELDLGAGSAVAPEGVSASGPLGELEAGTMTITSDGGGRVLFDGGVRLLYRPAGN